jgi:hypothetical protein
VSLEKHLSLRLPVEDVELIETMAGARKLSRSRLIRIAIHFYAEYEGQRSVPPVPDRREVLEILGERTRAGNISAAKLLLAEHQREELEKPTPFDVLDGAPSPRRNGRRAK